MNEQENNDKPFQDIEFKSLKIVFKSILIILFIVLSLMLVFSIKTVGISQDIEYTFENDVLYSSDNLNYSNTFNLRNQTIITQDNFTASYDFLNENIGTQSTDINYIDSSSVPSGSDLSIVSDISGHNNVLDYYQGSTVSYITSEHNLDIPQSSGSYEFYYYQSLDRFAYVNMLDGLDEGVYFGNNGDIEFGYNDGTWHLIRTFSLNSWYHIRIDFECGNGEYEGLIADTFFIYINNVKYGPYPFRNDIDIMDTLTTGLYKCIAENEYHVYLDAIGFSWYENYTIGQNLAYPNITTTSIQEVDKYEFRFKEREVFFVEGEDNPLGWSDIEIGGGDEVGTIDGDTPELGAIHVFCEGISDIRGIEKDDFPNTDMILNVSVEWKDLGSTDGMAYTKLLIKSSDSSEVINIGIRNDGNLYYDSTIIMNGFETDYSTFYFNIFIQYEINRGILRFYINNTYINTFHFPLLVNNKNGLSEISFTTATSSNDYENLLIYYIGVYANGTSLCDNDFGWHDINMNVPIWNNNHYNFLSVNVSGNFGLYICSGSYEAGFPELIHIHNFTYVNEYFYENRYKYGIAYTPFLLVHLEGNETFISFNSIHVEGCILTEGITKYNLDFTSNNINISNNYFYVENNRLYFYVDLNESSYEGMKASFNINNTFSTNATIRFKAMYSGNLPPYTILTYKYNPSSYYSLPYYPKSHNYLLPQNQEITHISINVSDYIPFMDNYTNHETGFISGYIYDIKLNYIPNIQYTITVMTLIYGFIPLIVILVPTFALYSKFGKQIIIPSLIFMSIICLVAQLIPVWLFSMLIIIFGYLVLVNRNEGVD